MASVRKSKTEKLPPILAIDAGDWTLQHCRHLINRASFGATPDLVASLHEHGIVDAVEQLLTGELNAPGRAGPKRYEPPKSYKSTLLQDIERRRREKKGRNRKPPLSKVLTDLQETWVKKMLSASGPLEKATLFWHGHFTSSLITVKSDKLMTAQNELLRKNAFGNVRNLAVEITHDPAMVLYLDINDNDRRQPNENFARELLELFTLGEGNYTEEDIRELALAFTGFHVRIPNGSKVVDLKRSAGGSSRYRRTREAVENIFKNPMCAEFICRKLWEFYVYEKPPERIIRPLAAAMRAADYEVKPVLRAIFRSKEFYSERAMHTQIKSPVQWMVQAAREFGVDDIPTILRKRVLTRLGQAIYAPPNVAGWPGGREWMSNVTLAERYKIMARWCGLPEYVPPPTGQGVRPRPPRPPSSANKAGQKESEADALTPFFRKVADDLAKQPGKTFQELNERFFNGNLSRAKQKRIKKRLHELFAGQEITTDTAHQLVGMLLCTPDYQLT